MVNRDYATDEQKKCPRFRLDDWGVCIYIIDWYNDRCKNNCKMSYNEENEK